MSKRGDERYDLGEGISECSSSVLRMNVSSGLSYEDDKRENILDPANENHDESSNATSSSSSTSSYSSDASSDTSKSEESSISFDEDDVKTMPLLKYGRILGDVPRSHGNDDCEHSLASTPISAASESSTRFVASTESAAGAISPRCVCSTMGRITLPLTKNGLRANQDTSLANEVDNSEGFVFTKAQTYSILAMAMSDSSIHLVNAKTGRSLCQPSQLQVIPVMPKNKSICIVGLSFNSTAKYLAALTKCGHVAIFELTYGYALRAYGAESESSSKSELSKSASAVAVSVTSSFQNGNTFDSFLSRLAGEDLTSNDLTNSDTVNSEIEINRSHDNIMNSSNPPTQSLYIIAPISTARFSYKLPHKVHATSFVLDPSYAKKREKHILVGFSHGRILLTKRSSHGGTIGASGGIGGVMGNLLQPKRTDVEIYQDVVSGEGSSNGKYVYLGIEALTWRGGLCAWADSSGMKIYDLDSNMRLAHIDRPTGAKVTLYSSLELVHGLKPSLIFETSKSLLIGWGDCLMNMVVKEKLIKAKDGATTKRKTVECVMAWELDCIACGIVPVDTEHVAVLGLVPLPKSDSEVEIKENEAMGDDKSGGVIDLGRIHEKDEDNLSHAVHVANGKENLVELQVISRKLGTVMSSDILPLIRFAPDNGGENLSGTTKDVSCDYSLMSSFATPKMADIDEADEEEFLGEGVGEYDIQNVFLTTMNTPLSIGSNRQTFRDPHKRWSIEEFRRTIMCDYDNTDGSSNENESQQQDWTNDDASTSLSSVSTEGSEYSDDYSFLFHQERRKSNVVSILTNSPLMVITSPHDTVLVQTRDIDDAIDFSKSLSLDGLALRYGLDHRRLLRRHRLSQLIQEYFAAILHPEKGNKVKEASYDDTQYSSNLSVRRLKLAARATPILLGGNIRLWDRWVQEFAKIPGGLFVLSQHLPVRGESTSINFRCNIWKMLNLFPDFYKSLSSRRPKVATTAVRNDFNAHV